MNEYQVTEPIAKCLLNYNHANKQENAFGSSKLSEETLKSTMELINHVVLEKDEPIMINVSSIMEIQPMTGPIGMAFNMRTKYGATPSQKVIV